MFIAIFVFVVLLFSIIIHEIAHGSVALALGDPTARDAQRLTLNPLRHLDPFGSFLLPLYSFLLTGRIFGFAKPVPVNPYNFRDQKWGMAKVSIAGPSMNFLIAIIFSLLIRFFALSQNLLELFSIIAINNFAWGIFNLVPIFPLDGFHIFSALLPERFSNIKISLQQYGIFILLLFIFFGLNFIFFGAMILYHLITGQPFIFSLSLLRHC